MEDSSFRELKKLMDQIKIPRFYKAKLDFIRDHINDRELKDIITYELEKLDLRDRLFPGMKVAITAGSRGINNIDLIIRYVVEYLKSLGVKPFIVPAMGSHGGASAEGQLKILESFGITEDSAGCPIVSSMEVTKVGMTSDGRAAYIDKNAAKADGVLLIGRIKPHTAFRGKYQSGLMKMMAVGLGKQYGAARCHSQGFGVMGANIEAYAEAILKNCNILGGLAIIENAFDETYMINAIKRYEIPQKEIILLREAERIMAKLPSDSCDVLIVDEIGKNFSGDGMDPNITGTFSTPYAHGGIDAERVCVLDLSPETHGNGMGIGMTTAVTKRLVDKLDIYSMYINNYTCKAMESSRIPCIMPSDMYAIKYCIGTCVRADRENLKIFRIFNTQFMEYIYISEGLADEVQDKVKLIGEPEELMFDDQGDLYDLEPRQRGSRRF